MPYRARLLPATHVRRRQAIASQLIRHPAPIRPLSTFTSHPSPAKRTTSLSRLGPPPPLGQRRHVSLEYLFPNVVRAWRDRQRSKTPISTPMTAVQDFRDALRPLRPPRIPLVDDMVKAYNVISLQAERQAQARLMGESSRTGSQAKTRILPSRRQATPVSLLTAQDVDEALEKLSALANGDRLVLRIWQDLDLLELGRTAQRREWVVRALCLTGSASEAAELVQDESGDLGPASRELWTLVLDTTVRSDPATVPQLAQALRASLDDRGESFDLAIYEILAQYASNALGARGGTISKSQGLNFVSELEKDFKRSGLVPSGDFQAGVASAYIGLNDLGNAENITSEWKETDTELLSERQWETLFDLCLSRKDVQGTIELMRRVSTTPVPIPQAAWTIVMDSLPARTASRPLASSPPQATDTASWVEETVARLDQVESLTGCHAGASAWTAILSQLPAAITPAEKSARASALWAISHRRGVPTDLLYAHALIYIFCHPHSIDIESILKVYRELFESGRQFSSFTEYSTLWTMHRRIMKTMIRAPTGYEHVGHNALAFLANMRALGIHAPAGPDSVSILCGLMRRCESHAEAFSMYTAYRALHPRTFTAEAYGSILATFIALSWDASPYPEPRRLDAIVSHMWQDGMPASGNELSALLSRYGQAVTDIIYNVKVGRAETETRVQKIIDAVDELYLRWRLDLKSEVRTHMLNGFMDAYQRCGALQAWQIWDSLVLRYPNVLAQYEQYQINERNGSGTDYSMSKPVENEIRSYQYSVSIALDMCSHSLLVDPARRIWAWLREREDVIIPPSEVLDRQKVWRGYLETLLRLGQWDEALDHLKASAATGAGGPGVGRNELQISVTFLRSASRGVQQKWAEVMYEEMREAWNQMGPEFRGQAQAMRAQAGGTKVRPEEEQSEEIEP